MISPSLHLCGLASLLACAPIAAIVVWLPEAPQLRGLPSSLFLTLPEDQPEIKFSLQTFRAPLGDWILQIEAQGFLFTESCGEVTEVGAIGHAHVYVDGQKVGTAYQPVFALGHLNQGPHIITVSLRAEDHRVLARGTWRGSYNRTLLFTVPSSGLDPG